MSHPFNDDGTRCPRKNQIGDQEIGWGERVAQLEPLGARAAGVDVIPAPFERETKQFAYGRFVFDEQDTRLGCIGLGDTGAILLCSETVLR